MRFDLLGGIKYCLQQYSVQTLNWDFGGLHTGQVVLKFKGLHLNICSATTGIRIASYFSHANVFCQTYSHSIHFGAETSHSLSTLQQYILVSL